MYNHPLFQDDAKIAASKTRSDCSNITNGTGCISSIHSARQYAHSKEVLEKEKKYVSPFKELAKEYIETLSSSTLDAVPRACERRSWATLSACSQTQKLQCVIVDFIRPAFEIAIAELNLLDEDGKRLGPNEAISIILDYGLRRANKINRIIPGIKFTECIPQVIADLFRMEGRDEKEKEIFRESVIEKMPEWRVLRKEMTQNQWQLLRKIGCGIPSWYSVLKMKLQSRLYTLITFAGSVLCTVFSSTSLNF